MTTSMEPPRCRLCKCCSTPESCCRHHSTEPSFLPQPRPRPHQLGLPEAVQGTLLYHIPGGPARGPGISRPRLKAGAGPSLPLTSTM